MDVKAVIANRLREIRISRRLTQEQTASRARLSYRYLQRMEAGTTYPTILTIFKLARALDTEPDAILRRAWKLWFDALENDKNP